MEMRRVVKPETIWLKYVRDRLRLSFGPHCFMIKPPAGIGSYPGTADLLGVIQGRAVALELKTPGGRHKLSPAQAAFLASWTAAGGYSQVIDSPESVEELIRNFGAIQGKLF